MGANKDKRDVMSKWHKIAEVLKQNAKLELRVTKHFSTKSQIKGEPF